jgi:N6-adenosine-specific RNA methylase IME4
MSLFADHDLPMSSVARPQRVTVDFQALRPAGGFGLIMADPPWPTEMRSEKGYAKSPEAYYATMPLDDIRALPVEALAAADCLLWLWARGSQLREAISVVEAWGFDLKTSGWWAKKTLKGKQTFGTGYILRNAGEPFLIGTRGAPRTTKSVRDTILGIRKPPHSRKPDEAFVAAERLMPEARRVELFSRQNRPGWTAWGDETGKLGSAA